MTLSALIIYYVDCERMRRHMVCVKGLYDVVHLLLLLVIKRKPTATIYLLTNCLVIVYWYIGQQTQSHTHTNTHTYARLTKNTTKKLGINERGAFMKLASYFKLFDFLFRIDYDRLPPISKYQF